LLIAVDKVGFIPAPIWNRKIPIGNPKMFLQESVNLLPMGLSFHGNFQPDAPSECAAAGVSQAD